MSTKSDKPDATTSQDLGCSMQLNDAAELEEAKALIDDLRSRFQSSISARIDDDIARMLSVRRPLYDLCKVTDSDESDDYVSPRYICPREASFHALIREREYDRDFAGDTGTWDSVDDVRRLLDSGVPLAAIEAYSEVHPGWKDESVSSDEFFAQWSYFKRWGWALNDICPPKNEEACDE